MFEHILAPVDLSERNDHALEQVAELAEPGTTVVTILHVIETIRGVEFEELAEFYRDLQVKAEHELARLREGLEKRNIECRCVVRYGPRGAQIVQFADESGCDLIVVTSHRVSPDRPHGGIGTTSHQVALLADCPVLMLR
jgi:nucleotide-binding universal stress UspA family protein